jgi:integrase
MNSALGEGLITENPYAKAHRVKGIEERQRFITESEYLKILSTVDRIEQKQEEEKDSKHQLRGWLKPYIEWAYESGMRRAEILNLTWANIRTLEGQSAKVEVRNTKTSNPRYVTCTGKMEAILKTLAALDREDGDNRLFPVSMTTLKRALTRLWKKCGVEDVRLHDLRRTHATLLMEINIDPRTVAGRLGHTGTGMLAKRYAVNRGDEFAAGLFGQRRAGKVESPAAEPGESVG